MASAPHPSLQDLVHDLLVVVDKLSAALERSPRRTPAIPQQPSGAKKSRLESSCVVELAEDIKHLLERNHDGLTFRRICARAEHSPSTVRRALDRLRTLDPCVELVGNRVYRLEEAYRPNMLARPTRELALALSMGAHLLRRVGAIELAGASDDLLEDLDDAARQSDLSLGRVPPCVAGGGSAEEDCTEIVVELLEASAERRPVRLELDDGPDRFIQVNVVGFELEERELVVHATRLEDQEPLEIPVDAIVDVGQAYSLL